LPWRSALRVLALILAVGTIPLHAFVLRKNPRTMGLEPDGAKPQESQVETSLTTRQALRTSGFWWMSAAFTLDRITIIAVAAHSVPMLLELGYSATTVAAATGAIGLMQLAGRLFFIPSMGKFSLTSLTAITFLCHSLGVLSLLLVPGISSIWLFASFHGIANGASTLARAALVADTYGSTHYGSINGSMVTMVALVQTIAPIGAGALHDASGNYTLVLWLLAGCSALAALAIFQIKPAQKEAV
jgi:cyanate permease